MKIRKHKLTRVPNSLIAKYFRGEHILLPIAYNAEEDCFEIDVDQPNQHQSDKIFKFFESVSHIEFVFPLKKGIDLGGTIADVKKGLSIYSIKILF